MTTTATGIPKDMKLRLGQTRSGKLVTTESFEDDLATAEDQFDALAILEAFSVREVRTNRDSKVFATTREQAIRWHQKLFESGELNEIMSDLEIQSYSERIRFGKRLLNFEYRE